MAEVVHFEQLSDIEYQKEISKLLAYLQRNKYMFAPTPDGTGVLVRFKTTKEVNPDEL